MDSGISNKTILDQIEKEGLKSTALWLIREAETTFPERASKAVDTYRSKILRIQKESKRLGKAKHTVDGKATYDMFMTETFKFPTSSKESSHSTKDRGSSVSKFTTDVVGEVTSKRVETEGAFAS